MASFTMSASLASTSSSFSAGKKLNTKMARRAPAPKAVTNAKYGDESVYFDLTDLDQTAGAWDMYGVDSGSRYPAIQEKFFANAADPLTRRNAMFSFLTASAVGGISLWGGVLSSKIELPITKGPQQEAVVGPRGRL